MQCLRSTEELLFACVPIEYALGEWQMRNAFKSVTAWWATMVVSGSEESLLKVWRAEVSRFGGGDPSVFWPT